MQDKKEEQINTDERKNSIILLLDILEHARFYNLEFEAFNSANITTAEYKKLVDELERALADWDV
jgi:hypothetical protein